MFLVIKMRRNENICKFVNTQYSHAIKIHNFVYEKTAINHEGFFTNDLHKIYLVTSGEGKLVTQNGEKKLSVGNIFFTFKQIPYKILNTNNINYMYISFDGTRCEELFSRFGISPINCIFNGHESLNAFWESSIIKAGEKNLDLISESVLLYTLGEMAAPKNNEQQHLIGSIIKFIEENFNDSEVNLNTISKHFGYNSKYVSRIFKNSMSITFSEYLTNIRIQHAIFLIEQNVTSVKNVALLSGYRDPLYFSNVFKTKLGISPKDFIVKKQGK